MDPAPLSHKAVAGILTGSIIGLALLISGTWFLLRRRRAKKAREKEMEEARETGETEESVEVEAKEKTEAQRSEMAADDVVELPTDKGDVELEAKHGEHEMLGQGSASGVVEAFELPGDEVVRDTSEKGKGHGVTIRLAEDGPDAKLVHEGT